MIEFLMKGGIMMLPLLGLALLAATLIVERFRYLLQVKSQLALIDQVADALANKKTKDATALVSSQPGVVAEVLAIGIAQFGQSDTEIEDAFKEGIYTHVAQLQKNLSTIQVLAAILPMMGLLGTITGMITVFKAIAISGVGDPQGLSSGISEALITTQTGLTFAIPALFFHNVLSQKVNVILIELKRAATSIVNLSRKAKG